MQEKSKSQNPRGGSGDSAFKYFFLALGAMLLIFAFVFFFIKGKNNQEEKEILESRRQQHKEIIEYRENETELPTGNYVGVLRNNNEIVIVARNEDELVAEIPGEINGLLVTTLGAGLFENSSVETVIIPESVSRIEDNCFKGCKKLKTVVMPEGLEYVGEHAFDGCESLSSIDLSPGVTHIGSGCFANCTSLTSFNLPSYLEIIEEDTFRNSALSSVKIHSTFEIHAHAFADCPQLTIVVIGATTESIDETAFDGSDNVVIQTTENTYAWKYGVNHEITVIPG